LNLEVTFPHFNLSSLSSFQCIAHFIHLVMGDVVSMTELKDLTAKVRAWVVFCRTRKGRELLASMQSEQNLSRKQLILVCF